jgi:hypothetical protein
MGSPRYPTQAQIAELNKASTLPLPEKGNLKDSTLALNLPVNGLAVVELPAR